MMFLTPFDKFSLLTNSGHRNAISLHTKYHTGKYHNRPEAMLEVRGNTEEWHSLSFFEDGELVLLFIFSHHVIFPKNYNELSRPVIKLNLSIYQNRGLQLR